MTRAQRSLHPVIWLLVTAVSLTVIVLAMRARPDEVPATLPDAAVQAATTPVAGDN